MRLKPLVDPVPGPLSADRAERFARHLPIPELGEEAQRRLANARVCVIGAGGLGSPALLYLAAAGVGTLGIVDDDAVEKVNLQRQVLHATAGIGRPKADSAASRLRELDPELIIRSHRLRVDAASVADLFVQYDVVVDAVDNFPTRYVISDCCTELGIPEVWAAVRVTRAQLSVFWSRPEGAEGPLAPITLRDVHPEPPEPQSWVSAAEVGVLGAMCGQVGAVMANETVKLITGAGDSLFGRIAYLDTMAATWREIPVRGKER
ncbi:MAG: HesA/MoeB/ThiF family protein [Propioniciclava sp.]